MLRITELRLPLEHSPGELQAAVLKTLGIDEKDLREVKVFRRSYDARKRGAVRWIYQLDVETRRDGEILERLGEGGKIKESPDTTYRLPIQPPVQPPKGAGRRGVSRPVVIGLGPCGLLAGLILAQMGLEPLILERGKKARERTKDTFGLWRKGRLHPESNVQFGEGGAGTFSDGKLYSRIKDPGKPSPEGSRRIRRGGGAAGDSLHQQTPRGDVPSGQNGGIHAGQASAAGGGDSV